MDIQFKKASPETIKQMEEQMKLMTSPELDSLQKKIENLIEERDRTREQLLDLYNSRGYNPTSGDKFWKFGGVGKGRGFYGWQIGQYEHSCHIDYYDIVVLLVIEPHSSPWNSGETYVDSYADFWLTGPIVV